MTIKSLISCQNPDVSVVIPTLPDNTVYTTPALKSQKYDNFEALLVEDNAIGICEARNMGIKEANADIIAQTDDDCRPPSHWISTIVDRFEMSDLVLLEGGADKINGGPRHYVGANLAYKKNAALAIGGFSESYAGWRDDTEFGWRMEKQYGLDKCQYDCSLEVEHVGPPRTEPKEDIESRFRREYPIRYFTILRNPDSSIGTLANYLIVLGYIIHPSIGCALYTIYPY